ncbi:phosphoenolpyruvate--protein phosphotransferase [Oscillospiraceae bacterium PP1C4]
MEGIVAVGGMAMAKAYLIKELPAVEAKHSENIAAEIEKLYIAKENCANQLKQIINLVSSNLDAESGEIFDFQLLMLEDKDFMGKIEHILKEDQVNCEYAVELAAKQYMDYLESLDNAYLNERSADIFDLSKRLIRILLGDESFGIENMQEAYIAVAVDFTPSQIAEMNRNQVKGLVLEKGGMSSHSVILARSMGIPCMIGVTGITQEMMRGDFIMIDSKNAQVIINPNAEQQERVFRFDADAICEREALQIYKSMETKTKDGFPMKVYANITSKSETEDLKAQGGEGVGLLRTELLYMTEKTAPSEEKQFQIYSAIAKSLSDRPLIIRTLDVGGDKEIPYLEIEKEENPFLGYRAIRYCIDHPDLFKSQIAAILRAGAVGNVQMMVPMVASLSELRQIKKLVQEVQSELRKDGISYAPEMQIGMMVETPAAVVMADRFAAEADFFSIGTNDLTQYLFAADRMNKKVAHLNSYFQPALIRAMKFVCDSAHKAGIEVDICGQAGEILELIPLWIAMGINNLSVSIPSITKVRRAICESNRKDCSDRLKKVMEMNTAEEVKQFLCEYLSRKGESYADKTTACYK